MILDLNQNRNFPQIISNHKKIVKDIKLEKYSPRKELFKSLVANTLQYDPNYDIQQNNHPRPKQRKDFKLTSSFVIKRDDKDPEEVRYQDNLMISKLLDRIQTGSLNSSASKDSSYEKFTFEDFATLQ